MLFRRASKRYQKDPPLNLYGDVGCYHFVVAGCYNMMVRYGHYKMVGSKDDISIK